jgi:DNA-binding transcriptional MerR regulator
MEKHYLTIGEIAERSGNRASTIKYYSEQGLLPYIQNGTRTARRYPLEECLQVLEAIRAYKEDRKTIGEIKQLLK